MNLYEQLEHEACEDGVEVIRHEFKSNRIKGLYCDGTVAINSQLETSAEKACVLAEEMGHHYTSGGDIIDLADIRNLKQEHIARVWAYNRMVGLIGIVRAFEAGCRNCYEIAEYLGVTEAFLKDALDAYRSKYGDKWCILDNYYIRFEPHLDVMKIF